MGAVAPHVIVIAKKVPADDLKGFIAYAQGQQGKLNYGSVGQGSVPHLGGVLFNKAAGTDLVHVPYKGAGPATADLVAGQVELLIVTPPSVAAHIRSGAVKALALASETRHPAFPDIPTTAEAGLPGFVLDAWFALFVPAGTPAPVVERLNAAMRKIAKDGRHPGTRQPARHRAEGLDAVGNRPVREERGCRLGPGDPRQQHHDERVTCQAVTPCMSSRWR
jgi:tripartite-type tricarboxylate transporter receptor subunit TctC